MNQEDLGSQSISFEGAKSDKNSLEPIFYQLKKKKKKKIWGGTPPKYKVAPPLSILQWWLGLFVVKIHCG